MSNQNHLLNITQFITKNLIASTLLAALLLGTTGVLAAQAFAPDNLKPFKASKTTNNSSISSSSLSSISSSASSSISSSASSKSVSSTAYSITSSTLTTKAQAYTNPFFPNFKLIYPEGWKFETKTEPSSYNELLIRKFTFSKNNYSFSIKIEPFIIGGCGGGNMEYDEVEFSNTLKKFTVKPNADVPSQNNKVFYGKDYLRCVYSIRIISNIQKNSIKNYPIEDDANKDFASYTTFIDTGDLEKNNSLIPEIDQIISQSSFK